MGRKQVENAFEAVIERQSANIHDKNICRSPISPYVNCKLTRKNLRFCSKFN